MAVQTLKNSSLPLTVQYFENSFATQIFREINFGKFKEQKRLTLTIFMFLGTVKLNF